MIVLSQGEATDQNGKSLVTLLRTEVNAYMIIFWIIDSNEEIIVSSQVADRPQKDESLEIFFTTEGNA